MWQDYFFGVAGALYTLVLLPTCLNRKSEVPRSSSVMTASTLAVSGVVYATLGMWWAASTCWADAAAWGFLFLFRPIRSRVSETALGEIAVDMAITEAEYELVLRYRETLERGALPVVQDGCGSCPSARAQM